MNKDSQFTAYDRLKDHWLVACSRQDIDKEPKSITILGYPIVLFRTSQGIAAMHDRCPHRGAPLSCGKVIKDCIQCPYHGWQFDVHGQCVRRPGIPHEHQTSPMAVVPTVKTLEDSHWIWVSLLGPTVDAKTPTKARADWGNPIYWDDEADADWLDGLENLLDPTHTPFVHAGLVRNSSQAKEFDAMVRVEPDLVEVEYTNEGKQTGWISQWLERERTVSYGRFIPPCLAQLEYRSRRGIEFLLNIFFTPTQNGRIGLFSEVYTPQSRAPLWIRRLILTPILRRVYQQDFKILEIQQQNLAKHPGERFISWEGDFIRGWIETWLLQGHLPSHSSKKIKVQI